MREAQLETTTDVQALVSECQLPLRTLRLLAGLAARAAATAARGAPLLDLLAAAADSAAGDVAARPRLRALLEVAAAPYFRCDGCHAALKSTFSALPHLVSFQEWQRAAWRCMCRTGVASAVPKCPT